MKKIKSFAFFFLVVSLFSCSSSKITTNTGLFDTSWELEYLSGPKIAFEGLYPDRKPKITFDSNTKRVTGTSGCNGYSADYNMNENQIAFGEPGPSTMMYCGEGETFFLNTIKKVNSYKIDEDGKLNLMMNDIIIMRFKKTSQK